MEIDRDNAERNARFRNIRIGEQMIDDGLEQLAGQKRTVPNGPVQHAVGAHHAGQTMVLVDHLTA